MGVNGSHEIIIRNLCWFAKTLLPAAGIIDQINAIEATPYEYAFQML
jgi:hypothetical protein